MSLYNLNDSQCTSTARLLLGHNKSAIGLMCLGVNRGDVIHGSQDKSDDKQFWETGTDEQ